MRLRYILFFALSGVALLPVLSLAIWVSVEAEQRENRLVEDTHLLLARNLGGALERYARDVRSGFELASELHWPTLIKPRRGASGRPELRPSVRRGGDDRTYSRQHFPDGSMRTGSGEAVRGFQVAVEPGETRVLAGDAKPVRQPDDLSAHAGWRFHTDRRDLDAIFR